MNIALFGGSFNPPHRHHIKIAEAVRDLCDFDEVWFVPVYTPVHKLCSDFLPYEARRNMLQAAIKKCRRLGICDVERDIGGPSYTINTIDYLRARFRDCSFSWVIGSDSLRDLPTWYAYERLIAAIGFVVITRPGVSDKLSLPNSKSVWLPLKPDAASSSAIRAALAKGRFANLPLHSAVAAIIVEAGYYNCWQDRYLEWRNHLLERLSTIPSGLRVHIESVAKLAAEYAFDFGLDPRLGYLAGLAHDLYRSASPENIIETVDRAQIRLSTREKKIPMLAHGAAAAAFLATISPPMPRNVISAVRYHTFPSVSASALTKALVMADTLDPARKDAERDFLRETLTSHEERWKAVLAFKRKAAEHNDTDFAPLEASSEKADVSMKNNYINGCI